MATSAIARVGRESDLVVDDNDRAACGDSHSSGEAEAFGHHALAGERRIAVHQHGSPWCGLRVFALLLVCLARYLPRHHD